MLDAEPKWLTATQIKAFHHMLIAEHGGSRGLRDQGLLESALNRPRNKYHYEEPSLFDLAAAYTYGFANNHPFVDGNKRVAATAIAVFLDLQGFYFAADESEVVLMTEGIVTGRVSENELAAWIEKNAH